METVPFAQRLRSLLGDRRQAWLAKRSGVEKSTVSRLLAGTQQPSAETIHLFAVALEVSVSDMVRGTDAVDRIEARAAVVQRRDFDGVLERFVHEERRRREADATVAGFRDELAREREASRTLRAEGDALRDRIAKLDEDRLALDARLRLAGEELRAAETELEGRTAELRRAVGEIATLKAQVKELSGAVDKTKVTAGVAAILAGVAATAGVASYFATTEATASAQKKRGSVRQSQKGRNDG